jgi:catechol 2,3-dioxygenase-like lactoylglutathione lyase family enzyme
LIRALLFCFLIHSWVLAQSQKYASSAVAHPTGAFFAVSVSDLASASKWYQEKLGLHLLKEGSAQDGKVHFVLLEGDGTILEIIQHKDAVSRTKSAAGEEYLLHGIFKMGMMVDDLDGVYRRVKENGIPIAYEIMPARDIPYRSFLIRDNEGNLIQFFGK